MAIDISTLKPREIYNIASKIDVSGWDLGKLSLQELIILGENLPPLERIALALKRPTTKDQLHNYVLMFFGIDIPRRKVCECCDAPFDAFAHSYFAEDPISIWWAARGSGKSVLLALLSMIEAVSLGTNVVLLGGSGAQAKRLIAYLRNSYSHTKGMFWDAPFAPNQLIDYSKERMDLMSFYNGGVIESLQASSKSIRGKRSTRLRIDECLLEGTLISTPQGYKKIEDLRGGDSIYTYNGNTIVETKCSRTYKKGIRPTLKIHLSNGKILCCTEDHLLLMENGWIKAKDAKQETALCGLWETSWGSQCKPQQPLSRMFHEKPGRKSNKTALRSMWRAKKFFVNDLQRLLSFKSETGGSPLCKLWCPIETEQMQALQTMSSSMDVEFKWGKRNGCFSEPQFNQEPKQIRNTCGGVIKLSGHNLLREAIPNKQLFSRFSSRKLFNRSLWELLAQYSRGSDRKRSSKEFKNRNFGLQNYYIATGRDPYVVEGFGTIPVRITKIESGPVGEVYDISVPVTHNFIAEGVVVHNCDECDLGLFDDSLGIPQGDFKRKIPQQITTSSTWHHPMGTMTEVIRRARDLGWPIWTWCYKECLTSNGGWLPDEDIAIKKIQVTEDIFEKEYNNKEPQGEGRIFEPWHIDNMFDRSLGEFEGKPGEMCRLYPPHPEMKYYSGADWARKKDFSVFTTFMKQSGSNPDIMVNFIRINQAPWPVMIGLYNKIIDHYPGPSIVDGTGLGDVVKDLLTHKADVIDFSGRKAIYEMYSDYIFAIQKGEVKAPFIKFAYWEYKHLTWEQVYSPAGHAPDSFVSGALAYAGRNKGLFELLIGRPRTSLDMLG